MDKGEKIHQNITRLAYEKGMGINDLCKQAKVSSGLIADLKHGRRENIGNITSAKLCKVLECNPEDILSWNTPHLILYHDFAISCIYLSANSANGQSENRPKGHFP